MQNDYSSSADSPFGCADTKQVCTQAAHLKIGDLVRITVKDSLGEYSEMVRIGNVQRIHPLYVLLLKKRWRQYIGDKYEKSHAKTFVEGARSLYIPSEQFLERDRETRIEKLSERRYFIEELI
jgi:hypothetical protein